MLVDANIITFCTINKNFDMNNVEVCSDMKKIIFDCDNTMGMENSDVEDGLTLLYLLGEDEIDVKGVTLTHGDSDIDTVYKTTWDLFDKFGIDVPLIKGCERGEDRVTEASIFLAENAARFPNEITILCTGSMSNIYGAYQFDVDFFDNIKEIIIMGGMLEQITINGEAINELNLSYDCEASYNVLFSTAKVRVLNGNVAGDCLFTGENLKELYNSKEHVLRDIFDLINPWYEFSKEKFHVDGFSEWAVATAVMITHPELFDNVQTTVISDINDLKRGILKTTPDKCGKAINMPSKITDSKRLNAIIVDSLKHFAEISH